MYGGGSRVVPVDTTGDGRGNAFAVDTNGDGRVNMVVPMAPVVGQAVPMACAHAMPASSVPLVQGTVVQGYPAGGAYPPA